MSFLDTVRRAKTYLEEQGRVSLSALKLEFDLDDTRLESLIEELVDVQQVAAREGRILTWVGPTNGIATAAPGGVAAPERAPRDYTPRHLADKILQSKSALEGERKQVTVLFADVKGSMELAEQLDPETWHQILDRFFQILTEGVHRFEGTINQYTGDGIMALFGAPIAHEDHAQRACHAALELRDALGGFAEEVRRDHGVAFSTRIGLNSGEVVVGRIGDDLRMDYTAQGHTVGLAQRIETLAHAGRPCLSDTTAKLVEGFFELEGQGDVRVKGARDPIRIHGLLGVGRARTRVDRTPWARRSPLVGRADEMAMLEAAFEQTSAGRGQVVGLVADAGVGKSRLAREFLQRVRAAGAQVVETHCPSHGKQVPLLMYLECVRRIYDIDDRDDPETARGKIESRFRDWFPELMDEMTLVFDFLGVPDPSRPLPPMTPEERQRRLTHWARRAMAARGERMCWVFLFEDMHWVDPASEALLGAVIQGTPGIRQMVLLTHRPEYTPPWGSKSFYRQVPLLPLTEPAMHDLLEALLGPELAGSALAERIRDRCMGTPFFVEELIHSLAERGMLEGERGAFRLARPVEEIPLPPTVQAVLAARIDRLDEREKRVLQAGAVIGMKFSRSLLARISNLPDAELDLSLDTLVQAEFIYEQALDPELELAFKHPLTQEVALGSQLRERRAQVHEAAAKALEELHADQLDEKAGLLAHHWEQAGDALAGARWHHRAARWVTGKAAQEALHHWRRVRDLTSELPDSDETIALGIASSMGLVTMGWHCGISPEETALDFTRCRELAEQAGDERSLAILHSNYSLTGGLSGPERIACYERANELARGVGERSLRAALGSAIAPFLWAGDLRGGLARSEESLGLIGQDLHLGEEVLYFIPYLWLRSSRAWLLGKLGRLAEAYQEFDRALGAVREHGTEFDQHYAYQLRASIECLSGDAASAVEHGRRAHEMSDRLGGLFLRAQSCTAYGAAQVAAGRFELAVSLLEEAVEANRRYGFLQWEAPGGHLARAHLECGRLDQALATARDAIDWSAHGGFRLFELDAQVALAAILARRGEEPSAIRAAVERADTLLAETGAGLHAPRVEEARALWAQAKGDGDGRAAALREAARFYHELGATGDAQRVARELAS